MSSKCSTCKGDPRGVMGLNQWALCPDCNDIPMNGAQKDRATYDLNNVLEEAFRGRLHRPDSEKKRSAL